MSTKNGEIFPDPGGRFREERERLCLSQGAVCEILGIKDPKTIRSWEGGSTSPSMFDLITLFRRGMDVVYVMTGVRSPVNTAASTSAEYLSPSQRIAGEISGLALDAEQAEALLTLARLLSNKA